MLFEFKLLWRYGLGLSDTVCLRCHKKEFLLKFKKDRLNWERWLFESKKRYGLIVLNYNITSNHIHLLVECDKSSDVISKSMKLIAASTSKGLNCRKKRTGSFWDDRYHATAVESEEYLRKCLVYIDLNMVRNGVVDHPEKWATSGYHEILTPKKRYGIINHEVLFNKLEISSLEDFVKIYPEWITDALNNDDLMKEEKWSESIAVGDEHYVGSFNAKLGVNGQKPRDGD